MANLDDYEAGFMEKLTKENYGVAKKFNFRRIFIDDLHTINNDGHLEMYHKNGEIYPKEMQLNKENVNEKKATFLDHEEEINNNILQVKTYDKQETQETSLQNLLITNHSHMPLSKEL